MHLRISKLWTDDDGMLHLELSASASGNGSTIDFYVYPEELIRFGQSLSEFDGGASSNSVFEVGAQAEPHYCWVRVEAYAIDHVGHSALEVCVNRNGVRHVAFHSRFSGIIEVASINELGCQVVNFATSDLSEIEFDSAGC